MGVSEISTRTDDSLGQEKANSRPIEDRTRQIDANEFNRLVDKVIELQQAVGTTTSPGASSIEARMRCRTAAALAALAGPYDGAHAKTECFSVRGDGGGGDWVWVAGSTATADNGMVLGALAGGRWHRIVHGNAVYAAWWGAKGDDATDCYAAIQAAVDYATSNQKGRVKLPPGICRISETIQLCRPGLPDAIRSTGSVILEGEGYRFSANSGQCGSAIRAMFSNMPAINIQGGLGTVVRGLGIFGQLETWVTSRGLGRLDNVTYSDTLATDWDDPSLAATADSRYAPYAAIAIDGWSGSAPPTTYPTNRMAYGQAQSTDTAIRDVRIVGFSVGIVSHPSGSDGNGDFTRIERVSMSYCKWGVSICNTQARNTAMYDVKMGGVFCCVTTNTHGSQFGKLGSAIQHLSTSSVVQWLQLGSSSKYGPLTLLNCYGEALWRIGDVDHNSSVESGIKFDGCYFGFDLQTESRGLPATVLGGTANASTVRFSNCFASVPSVFGLNHDAVCDGLGVRPTSRANNDIKPYLGHFHNATCGGVVFRNLTTSEQHRFMFTQYSLTPDGGGLLDQAGPISARDGMASTDRTKCIPAWVREARTLAGDDTPIRIRRTSAAYSKSSFSAITLTQDATERGKLELTHASITDVNAMVRGHEPGDAIWDDVTGMVFVIRSRTGTSIIAEAQNNYRKAPGATDYTTIDAFSTVTGNLYFLNTRIYTPSHPVIVDMDVNVEPNLLFGSATVDPSDLADGTGEHHDITVTGASLTDGDYVESVSASVDLQGLTMTWWVQAANTVRVRLQNETGGNVNLGAGTILRAIVRTRSTTAAVLKNVGRDDGYAAFLDADIVDNDRVLVNDHDDRWTSNTLITAHDGTAKTITLNGAVARTLARKRIPWFIRQPPANSATR